MSFYQNGILISGVNTLPELTRAQYEALPADKRPEYWVCLDEEYEPSSSGHEIENSAGTKLTQRDVMQVSDGLEAVDDSTNQKTKIKMNLPIVSSADWNAMTEQEKTAYKASHYRFGVEVPDTEGVINAEYMKLLWENPNTTQAFAAQTITLNSADYDFLMAIFRSHILNNTYFSQTVSKGQSILAFYNVAANPTVGRNRTVTYSSDTSLSVGNCYQNGNVNNDDIIPIAIYGIKASFQFKVNAIATDLSTRADHCFLSDNETSVEDKLEANNLGSQVNILSYTSDSPYEIPSDGYINISTSATNGAYIILNLLSKDNSNSIAVVAYGTNTTIGAYNAVYVKKGMRAYVSKNGTCYATFRPLS